MPQTMTPYGRAIGTYGRDGNTHLGGSANVLANPAVANLPHPALAYFDMLGVPDQVDPNNMDDLPHDSQTIASMYQHQTPTMIKKFLITDTLENELFQHFTVCPPIDASGNPEGIGTHVLRFGTAPLTPQPEGSSATLIHHKFERTQVHLERYGQAMELHDDFALTEDGRTMYQAYLNNMSSNMMFSGMMAVMTALLHCYDPKRDYVAVYGGNSALGKHQGLNTMNWLFGALHKCEKAYYQVAIHANQVGNAQSANGQYTHVFVTESALNQITQGDPYHSEYFRNGPGNKEMLEKGPKALTRMPDGTIIVKEPDYIVTGTDMQPGEKLQMLEQHVSTGRFNAVLLDDTLLTKTDPDPRVDMSLGFLNMDLGDGQIQVQKMADLVKALVCWGPDGDLRKDAYEKLASGKNAEALAQTLGIGSENLRPNGQGTALIDTFIVEESPDLRSIVRIVGNMHSAYLDAESQSKIARIAAVAVRKLLTEEDVRLMNVAIQFSEDNKNASPTSRYAEAFAFSLLGAANARRPYNSHGVPSIPPLANVEAAWGVRFPGGAGAPAPAFEADLRVPFPGFSSIKHLRTVRDLVQRGLGDWAGVAGLSADYVAKLYEVSLGVSALEKFARACKLVWSPAAAPNVFFRASALPFWNRSGNAREDEIDAFIQNIVLGIGYPTGFLVAANNQEALQAGVAGQDRFVLRFDGANAGRIIDDVPVQGFVRALGLDPGAYGGIANLKNVLAALYKNGAFGDSGNDFFPQAFQAGQPAAGRDAAAVQANFVRLFGRLVVESADGTETRGLAAVTAIIAERAKVDGDMNDVNVRNGVLDARIRAIAAMLTKTKAMADDAGPANGELRTDGKELAMAARLATMAARPAGNKRKLVRQGEEGVIDAAFAALDPNILADNVGQVANSTLSFSAQRWKEMFDAGAPGNFLFPADPANPVNAWLNNRAGFRQDSAAVRTLYGQAAREKYHIDDTCMGKISGAVFADSHNGAGAPNKRARTRTNSMDEEFGGHVAGAKYAYVPPQRDAFEGMPRNMRDVIQEDAMDVDGDTRDFFNARTAGTHRMAPGSAVAQGANKFFQWRWGHAIENYANDVILLAQHLLLLGARVHRDSFVNMIENGVPPPVGLVTVDPFIELSMTHAVFVVAGCGNLYYGFPQLSTSYDAMHKILHAYLTVWLKAHVHLPENVFIAENVAFNGYRGGGNGSLVRSIWTDTDEIPPPNGYDYDPQDPSARRAHRFVLHVGVRTRVADLPNPFPLTGTFGGRGAFHGVGRFVNRDQSGMRDRKGPLYDSALIVNEICKFHMLNRGSSANDLINAENFLIRRDMVSDTRNALCFMADQWGRNQATGSHSERMLTGTGPLGKLCPGVMSILHGKPGLIEKKMAICVF